MPTFEPLFPSCDEMDRRVRAAKHLRNSTLLGCAAGLKHKISTQRRGVQVLEASAAATFLAIAVFWATLLGAPEITEAGTDSISVDPNQFTTNISGQLPSFDENYQRHTGILDEMDTR